MLELYFLRWKHLKFKLFPAITYKRNLLADINFADKYYRFLQPKFVHYHSLTLLWDNIHNQGSFLFALPLPHLQRWKYQARIDLIHFVHFRQYDPGFEDSLGSNRHNLFWYGFIKIIKLIWFYRKLLNFDFLEISGLICMTRKCQTDSKTSEQIL